MSHKQFAERLNKELDNIGLPYPASERIEAFAKLLRIPKFQAESFLNGIIIPQDTLLTRISEELEVNAKWLTGESDHRSKGKEE